MTPQSMKTVTLRHPDPFPLDVIEDIKAHALAMFPHEAVGFVMPEGYMPVDNVHSDPENHFEVNPVDTAMALEGGVLALVHSHPDGQPIPSYHDQVMQIDSGLTWGIVPVVGINEGDEIIPQAGEITWWGDALPIAPLERRRFLWGVFHCWSLYRDWLRLEYGIVLPNFACDRDFVDDGHNIFIENCERAGLRNLGKIDMSRLQVGDMLVGHVKGEHPNHCGVYLGGDDFLHHAPGTASGKANLLRWWPHIDTVFRYDGLENATPLRGLG